MIAPSPSRRTLATPRVAPHSVLAAVLAMLLCGPAAAQLQVTIKPSRSAYVIHEPLLVTLTLTNHAGSVLVLEDTPGTSWLDFRIASHSSSRPATRRSHASIAPPIEIPPGQTIRRSFDLNSIFILEEMGTTVITAEVRLAAINRTFVSNRALVEITDGRELWSQNLGLPGTSDFRKLSLLTARLDNKNLAFLRIVNPETYGVYVTRPLGQIVLLADPQAQIDSSNHLHVLFMTAPKIYLHYTVAPTGEQIDRVVYQAGQTRPSLHRSATGLVAVVGGIPVIPRAIASSDSSTPEPPARLSERPPGLPWPSPK